MKDVLWLEAEGKKTGVEKRQGCRGVEELSNVVGV